MKNFVAKALQLFGYQVKKEALIKGPGYGAHGDYQNQMWYN